MIRMLLALGLMLAVPAATWASEEATLERPERAECAVCARRGGNHGLEKAVAWRDWKGEAYAFCSEPCAETFDQMPEGYTPPVFPRPAPEVALRDLDDAEVALAPPGARATIVDFWATWCVPCLEVMPELTRLYDESAEQGLHVVGISIDQDEKALRRFMKKKAPSYPVAHDDGDDPAWWEFRVPVIPALFLLDAEGQIVAQWGAGMDVAELRAAVSELLMVGGR